MQEFAKQLRGLRYREADLATALEKIDTEYYFGKIDRADLLALLLRQE